MTRSIFSKMLVSHIIVILISTMTLGLLLSFLIRNHVVEAKRHELLNKAYQTVTLIEPTLKSGRIPADQTLVTIGELAGATMWIVDQNGNIIAGRPPQRWLRFFTENPTEFAELFAGAPQSWARTGRKQIDPSLEVAIPITGAPIPTALFLFSPVTGINETIDALERLLAYSLLLGIAVSALFGLGISRSLTRPIANISQAARKFAQGNYSSRTTATGNDEIGALGRTFNHMAESLASAEQNRREFLANVTHELKTPIASIQALAETILDGLATQPEQKRRYLTTIVGETQRISRLINDLLDLARLEAGELSIHCQQLDLTVFLPAEKEKFTSLLADKNLTLDLIIPAAVPPVWADADRLSQILTNLIGNAIRHAPTNSSITIALKILHDYAEISIADIGPGIPPKDLPYIWDRFYRVDKSRARTGGGTGLGLSITKKLVQALNGDIIVSSQPGYGATFTFTLPIAG